MFSQPDAAPTSDQLLAHLHAHMPQAPRRWRPGVLLAIGVAVGVMLFAGPSLIAMLAPWLVVGGFLFWAQYKRREVSSLQNRLRRAREATLLRRPEEANDRAWHLIPDLVHFADFHVQAVMLMATNYMAVRAFEPAVAAQDYLIEHLPEQHPVGRVVRLQRLLGLLHEDRLSDADDQLRKLERTDLDPMGRAMLRAARMYQQIKTGHTEDAAEQIDADSLMNDMRWAGTDGGVGYGLAAAALLAEGRADEAQTWWHRATLLLPPESITRDVPELTPLHQLRPAKTLADAMREDGL